MHLDVNDLREFYYRTALGRAARRVIRDDLRALWPDVKGQSVGGFGFAAPVLRPYLSEARRVVALMPGPQGVMPWPPQLPNLSLLCEETLWPLATGFLDRLVVLHGLECSEQPEALVEECRRVLGPGGRAVFMVPNRAGLWSRSDATPFGHGRPYSMGQLEALLRRHRFTPERAVSTLYQPPSVRPFWRRVGAMMEAAGRHLPVLAAGGVLVVEATKQVPARAGGGLADVVRRPIRVLEGRPVAARDGSREGGPSWLRGRTPSATRP